MSYGIACGWPSAAHGVLKSNEKTPLNSGPMTDEELSWMVSLICIGGFIGNIFFGLTTNRWGRKLPLLSLAIPMTVGFMIIGCLNILDTFSPCFFIDQLVLDNLCNESLLPLRG